MLHVLPVINEKYYPPGLKNGDGSFKLPLSGAKLQFFSSRTQVVVDIVPSGYGVKLTLSTGPDMSAWS